MAGEDATHQRKHDGNRDDRGEGDAQVAEPVVAHVLEEIAERGGGLGRGRVAGHNCAFRGSRRGVGRRDLIADEEVGGEVLEQVRKDALDRERQQDRLANVPFRVFRLGTERGDRLEAHQQQDGDRPLVDDVGEVVRPDDRKDAVLLVVDTCRGRRGRRSP